MGWMVGLKSSFFFCPVKSCRWVDWRAGVFFFLPQTVLFSIFAQACLAEEKTSKHDEKSWCRQ